MCSITGYLVRHVDKQQADALNLVLGAGQERGRDAITYSSFQPGSRTTGRNYPLWHVAQQLALGVNGVVQQRAMPTTEWFDGAKPEAYTAGRYTVAHNGTVANDRDLRDNYGLPARNPIDSAVLPHLIDWYVTGFDHDRLTAEVLRNAMRHAVGSYAILVQDHKQPGTLYWGTNYKPLYMTKLPKSNAVVVSSLDSNFPWYNPSSLNGNPVVRIPPYSFGAISTRPTGEPYVREFVDNSPPPKRRALVVASGGLDSTVVLSKLKVDGYDCEMLHVTYGARAGTPELQAVRNISRAVGVPLRVVNTDLFTAHANTSPLTNGRATAEGIAGAEYAHEWVPARNLLLLAIATSIAEAHDFDTIALGNNLEEAGAYPDNEQEFVRLLNPALRYAVGDSKHVQIVQPVGNLVKHEIVRLGLELGTPFDLTWSCYEGTHEHCGECGPCYMRRTAFGINGHTDPVMQHLP